MKVICENGYYKFYPQKTGDLILNRLKLVAVKDYFTFPALAELPAYSIQNQLFWGVIPAEKTFCGRPEELLKVNSLTFNLELNTITPTRLVLNLADYASGAYKSSPNLIQAYSFDGLKRISGFTAFLDVKLKKYKYESFEYANI